MDATCNSRRNVTGKFYTGKETWDTVATNINLTGVVFLLGKKICDTLGWQKMAKFIYPTCIQRPRTRWSCQNFAKIFNTGKTRMKKLWRYVKPLRYNTGTWHTDRHCQSDRMYIARQHCCNKGLWRIRAFFTTAVARFRFFHPELLRKFSCLIVHRADVINLHRVRSLRRRFCHSTQLNYRTTSPWDVAAMKSAGVDVDRSFHLLQADISSFHASLSTCYIMTCGVTPS